MSHSYKVDDPLDHRAVANTVTTALNAGAAEHVERIGMGSTNLIYRVKLPDASVILKVSHRPDRIETGVLAKEANVLRRLGTTTLAVPIPTVLWEGKTDVELPAIIITHLPGQPISTLLGKRISFTDAFRTLGAFNAQMNQQTHDVIDEFEPDRPRFESFPACATYWLDQWKPLLDRAEPQHVSQAQLNAAREYILGNLSAFDDEVWSYVHSDLSAENVLGTVKGGQLILTGVCDFETVQTGPVEYDLGTAWNNYFVRYPSLEQPFMEGYTSVRSLHPKFNERMVVSSLFRALRYMKRSVKYKEVHYYDQDRQFLETWLERAK